MIYFVQVGWEDGPIKIGYSANLSQRISMLRVAAVNTRVWLLSAIPGDMQDEKALHRRFAAHRIRGEYFRPDRELLDFIDECPCPVQASLKYRIGGCLRLSPTRKKAA
jgi:hypothetical protein